MRQLFSKFVVAFLLTSAVVLSWSEYFFNLNLIYATFRLVLKVRKKSRIVTEEGGHTLQQNDRSIKITVKPR